MLARALIPAAWLGPQAGRRRTYECVGLSRLLGLPRSRHAASTALHASPAKHGGVPLCVRKEQQVVHGRVLPCNIRATGVCASCRRRAAAAPHGGQQALQRALAALLDQVLAAGRHAGGEGGGPSVWV